MVLVRPTWPRCVLHSQHNKGNEEGRANIQLLWQTKQPFSADLVRLHFVRQPLRVSGFQINQQTRCKFRENRWCGILQSHELRRMGFRKYQFQQSDNHLFKTYQGVPLQKEPAQSRNRDLPAYLRSVQTFKLKQVAQNHSHHALRYSSGNRNLQVGAPDFKILTNTTRFKGRSKRPVWVVYVQQF